MRLPCLFVLGLASLPAFALEYPDPPNPAAKALVAQYKQDKALLDSPDLFAVPNPAPQWPCAVPEIDQYKVANLDMAHPALKADIEKLGRKAIRAMGMATGSESKTTYSDIRIVPLKAQCVNGKLHGEIELLAFYTIRTESPISFLMGEKVVNGNSVNTMKTTNRLRHTLNAGERTNGTYRMFMLMEMQQNSTFDDPQMAETMRKTNESIGGDKPMVTQTVSYAAEDGTRASFTESEEKKVSFGLFSPNIASVQALSSMFMHPIDEHRTRSENYKNKQLTSISTMKGFLQHGESITYMENYLKPLKLRLDQQPNMENAREVTIDGVDLIEQRKCFRNGAVIKTATCPND